VLALPLSSHYPFLRDALLLPAFTGKPYPI
jgi:hypothetical protein